MKKTNPGNSARIGPQGLGPAVQDERSAGEPCAQHVQQVRSNRVKNLLKRGKACVRGGYDFSECPRSRSPGPGRL